jgi:hypothetical protein
MRHSSALRFTPLWLLAVLLVAAQGFAARIVTIRVDPPQDIQAITLRSGERVLSLAIREDRVEVPDDFPFPWTVGLVRFEPVTYTATDLRAKRPLTLGELGIVRGMVAPGAAHETRITWLLQRALDPSVTTIRADVGERGAFEFRLPAGTWNGAALGDTEASRIRSAIVVRRGLPTEIGAITLERALSLSFRIVDATTGSPVPRARAVWDPPPTALNSAVARVLFSEVWSGIADRRGLARIRTAGPLPLAARWRVEAEGYADTPTPAHVLTSESSGDLGEVRLRPEAVLVVNAILPDEESDLVGATLILGDRDPENQKAFEEIARAPLRPGTTKFPAKRYGPKRLRVVGAEGRLLAWHDFDVDAVSTSVELRLEPLAITGVVSRRSEGMPGAWVSVADPAEGRSVLARVRTGESGRYALRTWQRENLFIYAIAGPTAGVASAPVRRSIESAGGAAIEVDFEIATGGVRIAVVDAGTKEPLIAEVRHRIMVGKGRGVDSGVASTDRSGRLQVENQSDGIAHLVVKAPGYRTRELEFPLEENPDENQVALERAEPQTIRVVDPAGRPISGAEVSGGYSSELATQPSFLCTTDGSGACRIDSPPPTGTTLYVVARGFALSIEAFPPNGDLVAIVHPPGTGGGVLRPDHALPTKLYLTTAAPAGGRLVPMVVLAEVAFANGLTPYQLQGSAADGTLVLPQFLGPGRWDLYLALRGGSPYLYRNITTFATPLREPFVVAFPIEPKR